MAGSEFGRELEYQLCDVFTATPLEGNQLAVFLDAGSLSCEEMQALAKETNLSETTFICRRDAATERERGVRVRIFTTQEELPFAGHPTLGTAATIRRTFPEYEGAARIVLDLNAGPVPVVFPADRNRAGDRSAGDKSGAAFGEMMQPDPVFGATHDAATVAPLLGLRAEDCATESQPQTVSTGLPYCVVALLSTEALGRLRVDLARSEEYFRGSDAKFFYVIAPEASGVWRARMQFYNGEDPATGSGAGCAIAYMVQHGIAAPREQLHLRQGVEIRRPSDLYVSANSVSGKIAEVRVAGSTVRVANGRFFLE
ncbi:MAG: PhzF family phenazine biosynthesis protein [Silvibacterium sp.]